MQQPQYEPISPPATIHSGAAGEPNPKRKRKESNKNNIVSSLLENDLMLSGDEDTSQQEENQHRVSSDLPPKSYFQYFPLDGEASLVHMLESSPEDCGIQVTIVGRGHKLTSPHSESKVKHIVSRSEGTERLVVFQVAQPGKPFIGLENDPTSVLLVHSQYLELLKFMSNDWPQVRAKLVSDCQQLADGQKLAWLNGSVYFRGPGGAKHTYNIGIVSPNGDNLRLLTSAFVDKTTEPSSIKVICTLSYKLNMLGSITFNPQPLINLARDLPTLTDYLVYKGRAPTIQTAAL